VGASSSSSIIIGCEVAIGVNAVGVLGRASGGRGGKGADGMIGCGRVSIAAAAGGFDFAPVVESESESSAGGGCDADDGAFFWVTLISAPVLACRHLRRHITMRSWSGPRSIVAACEASP
jgi:hypothetical protein